MFEPLNSLFLQSRFPITVLFKHISSDSEQRFFFFFPLRTFKPNINSETTVIIKQTPVRLRLGGSNNNNNNYYIIITIIANNNDNNNTFIMCVCVT